MPEAPRFGLVALQFRFQLGLPRSFLSYVTANRETLQTIGVTCATER